MKKRKWIRSVLVLLLTISMIFPSNAPVYAAEMTETDSAVQSAGDAKTEDAKIEDAKTEDVKTQDSQPADETPEDGTDKKPESNNTSENNTNTGNLTEDQTSENTGSAENEKTPSEEEDTIITLTTEEASEEQTMYHGAAPVNTDNVAQVGKTKYASIAADISAAKDGETVKLLTGLEENVTVPEGKKITLDLNGQTIEGTLINKGTLTIDDTSEAKTGKIVGQTENTGIASGSGAHNTEAVSPHAVVNQGTLTIKNGTFDVTRNGTGALFNGVDAVVTIEGGTFTRSCEDQSNTTESGGENSWYTVKNYGTMTINDGKFVLDGHFSSMLANGWQSGNDNTEEKIPVLTINGGTFSGGINTIKNDDWGSLNITGGEFGNVTQHVVMNWNTAVISGGTFTADENYAVWNGHDNDNMDKGELTITGGTITSKKSCAVYNNKGTLKIEDGNFTSSEKVYVTYTTSGGTVSISGGTYSSSYLSNGSPDDYCPGYVPAQNTDGSTYSLSRLTAETAVASVTSNGTTTFYSAFSGAVSAAQEGDTVTLLKDDTIDSLIVREKVTIDLGGNTLSIQNGSTEWYGMKLLADCTMKNGAVVDLNESSGKTAVYVEDCSLTTQDLTIQAYRPKDLKGYSYCLRINTTAGENTAGAVLGSGTLITDAEIPGQSSGYETYGAVGVAVFTADGVYTKDTTISSLTVESGAKIDTTGFAVSGNGTAHNTSITIKEGAELISDGTAIYHPQGGTLNIEGGTITGGKTGIEIRSGVLNMKGGTVTGNGTPTETTPNGNGTTHTGAGIAIAQHTTKLPISVNISGGSIAGYSALYESNPQKNSEDDIGKVKIEITNGNFATINGGTCAVYSEDVKDFISGGIYTTKPSADYIAPDKAALFEVNRADGKTYLYEIGKKEATEAPSLTVTYGDPKVINDVSSSSVAENFVNRESEIACMADAADIAKLISSLDEKTLKELRGKALTELQKENNNSNLTENDVYLHIQPYAHVTVKAVKSDSNGTSLELEIVMKYDLIGATAETLARDGAGELTNGVVLESESGKTFDAANPLEITLPVPEGLLAGSASGSDLVVKHETSPVSYYGTDYSEEDSKGIVSFTSAGGSGMFTLMLDRKVTVVYGTETGSKEYSLTDLNTKLPAESRQGYVFKGWKYDGLGDTVYSGTLTEELMNLLLEKSAGGASITAEAQWAKVSSVAGNGSSSGSGKHHSSSDSDSDTSAAASSAAAGVTSARTGDETNLWFPILLLLLALAGMSGYGFMAIRRKKK